jgi:general secretion pathway protein D
MVSQVRVNINRNNGLRFMLAMAALGSMLLTGCERSFWDPTVKVNATGSDILTPVLGREAREDAGTVETAGIRLGDDGKAPPSMKNKVVRGTGTFVNKVERPTVDTTPGDITLNFDGTDIREVVKVILGDILGVNYVLDPAVTGTASLETGRPLSRTALIPTLETLLRMNNAALVQNAGSYEVVPLANAIRGRVVPQLGETSKALPAGYNVQVIPLRYIGAEEMSKILEPLAPEGSIVRADTTRNLLILAGTGPEIRNLLDTIQVFDVDWMAGLSVGFFSLEYANPKDLVGQLEALLSDEAGNPMKGIFRFVPVDSARSVLVVSPQEKYLAQARVWIERLDAAAAAGDDDERLYVYRVKHGDAELMASSLIGLFSGEGNQGMKKTVGSVAPGLGMASGKSSSATPGTFQLTSATGNTSGGSLGTGKQGSSKFGSRQSGLGSGQGSGQGVSGTIEMDSTVSIVADVTNNSLLIKSSPRDYKKILDALKQLDIVPLQVLIEATFVEITLDGNLQYGVQWHLTGKIGDDFSNASLSTASGLQKITVGENETTVPIPPIDPKVPGFNWTVITAESLVRANLNLYAAQGLLNVLSSPSVMVRDNQVAHIQVGEQVPILTQQQQSTQTNSNVLNSISYKDTGVMLDVKPRVTPGGMVQMDVDQQVSTNTKTNSSAIDSPTFIVRQITSNVAVRSGQAVVLGGLIENQDTDTKGGVPGLSNIPVLGALFSDNAKTAKRKELLVILTPKIIASDQDAETVTNEFRSRMKGLGGRF